MLRHPAAFTVNDKRPLDNRPLDDRPLDTLSDTPTQPAIRLGRSSALVFSGTALSRVAGLLRDIAVFTQLGISPATDALVLALRIPATFYRYFVDAGLVRLLVPQLVRAEDYKRYVATTLLPCVLTAVGMAALLGIFAPTVVSLLAPGFTAAQAQLAQELLRLIAFYIPLALLVGYFNAMLNSRHRYGLSAYMQVLLNLVIAAAAVAIVPLSSQPQRIIAGAMVVGGLLQVLVLVLSLWRLGMLSMPTLSFGAPFLELLRGIGIVLLVTLPQQLGLWVAFAIGSLLEEGVPTLMYLAERLVQLPLALIGIAMATIVLPVLSRQNAEGQRESFVRTLDWALKVAMLSALPAMVGMWLTATHLAEAVFGYRAVGESQTGQIALVTLAIVLSLPFSVTTQVILAACFSRSQFRPMFISAFAGATVLIGSSWLLAVEYGLGAVGLGLGVSFGALAGATALVVLAIIEGYWVPAVPSWLLLYARAFAGCALMAPAVIALGRWGEPLPLPLLLTLQIVVGIGVYLAVLRLSGLRLSRIWRYDEAVL